MLSNRIKILMSLLRCNNTDIANYANCSSGNISKLKTGRWTPDRKSPAIRRFSHGVYRYAETEGLLDTLRELCGAEDLSEEAVISALSEWLFEEGDAALPSSPAPMREQRRVYRRKHFANKLDRIMELLQLSNSKLAAHLNVDPSLISRYRDGLTFPRENPLLATAMSDFLYACAEQSKKTEELAQLCSLNVSELDPEALSEYLFGLSGDSPSSFAKALLRSLNSFTPGQGVPVAVPKTPAVESAPYYSGTGGLRSAVVRFLTDAAQNGGELLLYSDEPMDWIVKDRDYFALWAFLMINCVKNGVRIKIIHNLDRVGKEMVEAISGWFPLYISGMIEPYLFRTTPTNRFNHTIFLHRGKAGIRGFFPRGSGDGRRYDYITDEGYLSELEKEFDMMLSGAVPFLKTYPSAMSEAFRASRISGNGTCHYLLSELPIFTMPEALIERMLHRSALEETQKIEAFADYREARKQFLYTLRRGAVDLLLYPYDENEPRLHRANFALDLLELSVEYTKEEYCEHISSLLKLVRQQDNLRLTLLPSSPFSDLQIAAMRDTVTILRSREPYAAFVFSSPMLTKSISDYFESLIELHGTDLETTMDRLTKLGTILL